MRAVAAWVRAQLRNHLGMLLALGLLVGAANAAALAALAGAQRTATVYERHAELTNAPHAMVFPEFDPELWTPGVLDPFFEIDGIESFSEGAQLAMRPVGTEFSFLFERTVIGAVDDRFGREVNRFRMVEGRAYDHRREDEAVITEEYAEAAGISVGDIIRFESWTPDAVVRAFESNFAASAPEGPVVDVTVVGITRDFLPPLPGQEPGAAYLTEAFTRRWRDAIANGYPIGFVRLEEGAAGFASFVAQTQLVGEQIDIETFTLQTDARAAEVAGGIDAQVSALWVFAAVAGVAGAAVAFAALTRQLSVASADQVALRAIGMTGGERAIGVAMMAIPTALAAAATSAGVAFLASGLLPIGTPGRIEPDPGLRADPVVLAAGAGVVAVIVIVLAGAVGASVTRTPASGSTGTLRASIGISIAQWFASSAPISIGVRQALDRGRGERTLPVRSTLVGCVIGVTGVVGALAFGASLNHLTETPRLYGWAADAFVGSDGGPAEWQRLAERLESDPDIDKVATVISTDLIINEEPVGAVVLDPRRGDPVTVIVSGRAPQSRDEVVIGRAAADRLGVGPDDTVSVSLADESASPYRIVGIAAHPKDMGGYRDQVTVLGDSLDPFLTYDTGPWYGVMVTFADGVDPEATVSRFQDEEELISGTLDAPPGSVENLDEVGVFPVMLTALLGLLAAVFLLHALAVGTRRRAKELAVLRALGFSRRQLRMIAVSQATTISVVSLAIGVPLGLGIGRTAWSTLASDMGVATEHRLPPLPVLWVVAVVGAANLLGLVAARRAVDVRPAVELRGGRIG